MLVVAGIRVDAYPFCGFLRTDLSPRGYQNRCFLVALCHLIVRRPNLQVATKMLLHQQVEILGSLKLFPVVRILLRSQGVICYDICVLSEGHKNYFNDWFFMNSQHTFLFLTNLNSMNYGHIIKSM